MVFFVLMDTNFLLLPETLGIDVFNEIKETALDNYEFIILQSVYDELNKLCADDSQSKKHRDAAKLGLEIIKQKNLKIEHCSNEHTDDALLKKALELKKQGNSIAIATQDKELISRARKLGIQVFALRQKKKILLLK